MATIEVAENPSPAPDLLSIGELSDRSGVPASTLRYYDDLGLLRPAGRAAGRRRYNSTSERDLGLIVYLREVGFTLAEINDFVSGETRSRRDLVELKLTELVEHQRRIRVAIDLLEHGRVCPADDQLQCPRFWSIIESHQSGLSMEDSHARSH